MIVAEPIGLLGAAAPTGELDARGRRVIGDPAGRMGGLMPPPRPGLILRMLRFWSQERLVRESSMASLWQGDSSG